MRGSEVFVQGFGILDFDVGDGEAGEVFAELTVEKPGLFFGVSGDVEVAPMLGEIAEALFGNSAFESAVGLKLEAGGAVDGIEIGRENRKLNNLAVTALDQDAVPALEVVLKLAKSGLLPGWIEDEVLTPRFCGDDAAKFG